MPQRFPVPDRYRVFGYRDDPDDCVKERVLGSSNNKAVAIREAKRNPLATCVIDSETDKEVWTNEAARPTE